MKKCEKCGKEYEVSKRDMLLRKLAEANSRLFPTFHTVMAGAKNYCNECFKETVVPAGEAMLAGVKDEPNA
jgi:hypothetical protein